MTDEAREKREAGRQRAKRDVETLTGIHGQEDVVARRRIQTLERSVERLERRLTAVEREATSPRQHPMRSLMRPAGGLAKDEEAEQGRRRLLLAAVAFGVGLMILLVGGGLLALLFRNRDAAGSRRGRRRARERAVARRADPRDGRDGWIRVRAKA